MTERDGPRRKPKSVWVYRDGLGLGTWFIRHLGIALFGKHRYLPWMEGWRGKVMGNVVLPLSAALAYASPVLIFLAYLAIRDPHAFGEHYVAILVPVGAVAWLLFAWSDWCRSGRLMGPPGPDVPTGR